MPRRRLLDKLTRAIEGKLTLIVAPAGYGKMKLISDWLVVQNRSCAWHSLEIADNLPQRFFLHLPAALAAEPEAASRRAASSKYDPLSALTEREVEVLQLIAAGSSNKEIQAKLFIS